jgi:uncharacterized damage-inducible protein DinB
MVTKRAEPPLRAGEREMLLGWLDYHRATLLWKCEGLSDDQLRERAVPPSSLCLIGLVRHLAECEHSWFRRVLLGEDTPYLYVTEADNDADFNDVAAADIAADLRTFERACEAAREAVASVPDLDALAKKPDRRTGEQFSLRWIVTHMIEEYARHNGHADLLRERIDGATGD